MNPCEPPCPDPKPPQNPNPNNLKTTLSALKTLIHLSQSNTNTNLPTPTPTLIPCPFNPHHHIPPQSLFSHSLHCQTPPLIPPSPSTFFYQNCPSVVSLPSPPSHHPLTLPHFLATFIDNTQKGQMGLCQSFETRFLASEYMFVKREIDGWNEYPLHYSCVVRRVFLCLGGKEEVMDGVSRWVMVNSPRYGVIIDVSVSDHVVLLLKLCLRVIISEAIGLRDVNEFYLKCPVLCQVLAWYGTQLGILYGEMNGNLFALNMLKQLILDVTMKFLMFSDEVTGSRVDDVGSDEEISVSQVENAVAAFRERSLLEEKIKAVRYSRELNRSQRVAEHEYIAKRAEEERHKRPDIKPIIEHDLFSWQRGRNKDTSVTKSREELLAEERDYKRRRMSYRGKKIKRTTTQVMRDIIEEYTEEIKAAEGFSHLQHVDESGKPVSDSLPVCNTSADSVMEKGLTNSSDVGSALTYNRIQSCSYEENRSIKIGNQYIKDLDQLKPKQNAETNRYHRKHNSKRSEKLRHNGRTGAIEQSSVRGQRDVTEARRESSRHSLERNYSSSREHSRHRKEQFDGSEGISRRERSLRRSRRSDSVAHKKFEDRYDPSES